MTAIIDKMMSLGADAIQERIGEKDDMMPVWHIMYQDGHSIVIGTPWGNQREKIAVFKAMRQSLRATNAVAYCVTIEAWLASEKLREGETLADFEKRSDRVRPSQRPDRIEVLMAFASDGTEKRSRAWNIHRDIRGRIASLSERNDFAETTAFDGMVPSMLDA